MTQTAFRAKMAHLLMYALNRCSRRTHLMHLRLLSCLYSTAFSSVMGRKTALIDKLAFSDILGWLATGYRMYTSGH